MSAYQQIKDRPAPRLNCTASVKRVIGGYVVSLEAMATKETYWSELEIVCKSFSEVILVLRDWQASPEDKGNVKS